MTPHVRGEEQDLPRDASQVIGNHPRMRGEECPGTGFTLGLSESPPRARGRVSVKPD